MTISILEGAAIGADALSETMFGGNTLFDRDLLKGTFPEVVDRLGVTSLRYPGGSLSEERDEFSHEFKFDVTNPNATSYTAIKVDESGNETSVDVPVLPVAEFIAYANLNNLQMSFVIPTSETYGQNYEFVFGVPGWTPPMENGVAVPMHGLQQQRVNDILQYAKDLIDGVYGDTSGAVFEIGNEFYAISDFRDVEEGSTTYPNATASHTDTTYGIVASHLSKEISDYAQSVGKRDQIEIHVQAGTTELGGEKSKSSHRNSDIIAEFDGEELDAIDGIISHFYPWDETSLVEDDPDSNKDHNNDRAQYINAWNAAAGRELKLNVSEWNVGSPNGVDGLHQVAVLAEFLEFFQRNGVDMASVWPLQQNNQSDLSGNEGTTELTLAGEFFQMASGSLTGKTLFSSENDASGIRSYYYSDNGTSTNSNITLVLVNSTESVLQDRLDLTGLAGEGDRVCVSTLTAHDDGTGTPAYINSQAEAHLSVESYNGADSSIPLDFMQRGVIVVNIARSAGFNIQSDLEIGKHSDATGAESFIGSQFDDAINLGAGDDTLAGDDGADTLRGADGDDSLLGGAGADVIHGGEGTDTLLGDDGSDNMFGDAGDDLFYAGSGDDTLNGGEGNDIMLASEGDDLLFGDAGADTLGGSIGDDELFGGHGTDHLFGDDGNDALYGDAGEDQLFGGVGSDTLDGGADNDVLQGEGDNDVINGGAGDDILYGQDGLDTMDGGLGSDLMHGGWGQDQMAGGEGNDRIYGNRGDDIIAGDGGDDTLYGYDDNDIVRGGDGADLIFGGRGADILEGGAGADTFRGESGDDTIVGGTGQDILNGDDGNDVLLGGADMDSLVGGQGNDSLAGEEANDRLYGGDGDDTLDGGEGDDFLLAESDNDLLLGREGNDQMYGMDGDDFVFGHEGADTLEGGAGDDYLDGGADNDRIIGGNGDDTLEGGAGRDILLGYGDDDALSGGDGNDWLYGGDGADTLAGGDGDDTLRGESGDDVLAGGQGTDALRGGDGADTFVFATGDGNDTVYDFQAGVDAIDLVGLGFTSQEEMAGATTQRGADVWISTDSDDLIILSTTEADVESQSFWSI